MSRQFKMIQFDPAQARTGKSHIQVTASSDATVATVSTKSKMHLTVKLSLEKQGNNRGLSVLKQSSKRAFI